MPLTKLLKINYQVTYATVLNKSKIRVILSALVTALILYGGNVVLNAGAYSFETPMLGYYFVKLEYHTIMNDYFNEKITLLVETKTDDPDYSPPAEGKECGDDNVSTYCVAMGALDRYDAYISTLNNVMGHFGPTDGDVKILLPLIGSESSVPGLQELNPAQILGLTGARNNLIKGEKENARRIMDSAIGAYNELRTALPMHEKYKEIVVALTLYRENLNKIRAYAEKMPPKFKDVTSATCK